MTEAEARYIQRLPGQMEAALRKVRALNNAHRRYGLALETEAQSLLRDLYGDLDPGLAAEADFQRRQSRGRA